MANFFFCDLGYIFTKIACHDCHCAHAGDNVLMERTGGYCYSHFMWHKVASACKPSSVTLGDLLCGVLSTTDNIVHNDVFWPANLGQTVLVFLFQPRTLLSFFSLHNLIGQQWSTIVIQTLTITTEHCVRGAFLRPDVTRYGPWHTKFLHDDVTHA